MQRNPPPDVLQIAELIGQDDEMMRVLQVVSQLALPDWCICAGFIKNKVWDYVHGNKGRTKASDIDVMFFERSNRIVIQEALTKLQIAMPSLEWDIANQAFAHTENGDQPYTDLVDALSKLPETATSVAVRLENGEVKIVAPHGTEDLANCIIRPTPIFYAQPEKKQIIVERLHEKRLFEKWPLLKVVI